ncbi:DNA glycosylase AlkZ-like family protein [Streptomyces sp. NBC_01445]|uniref:DNA glycosylase AlkZ-like family protein n=1 Tax=Streptomyces sp. NBC_01445 TaxID=2903869 RepID=UPI002DDB3D2C|nr:crosslink repair DNA glycosylase YcaQ family protein [Streptomyces sp. NBC_01445]WSE02251.1 winged helix DNA-binding domain-containing protein [Streptomyces sp. NBC_01445]
MTTLSHQVLNRALMRRQFLLRRTDRTRLEVTGRLVALQAQEPNWAYVGLWSRIHGFTQSELTALLEDRQVVRCGPLRSTQHFAAADDFRRLRSLLQPVLDRTAGSPHFTRNSTGLDAASLAAEGLALLAGGTLPRKELTGVAEKLLDDGKLPEEHRQRIIENRDFARSKLRCPRERRHGNSSAPDPRRQAPRPATRPFNVPPRCYWRSGCGRSCSVQMVLPVDV